MLDWRQFVRERLGPLGLPPRCEQEISVELADHLQDGYTAAVLDGLAAEQAAAKALDEVPDWAALNREIFDAKREESDMRPLTKRLWLPGVVMLFLYAILLRLVMWAGVQPDVVFFGRHLHLFGYTGLSLVLYGPWLVLLPVVGALGAWWSRRFGGGIAIRLLTGLFPVTVLVALMILVSMLAFVVDPQVPMVVKDAALAVYFLGWVLIPGAALFLGVLPFLGNHKPESASAVPTISGKLS